MLKLRALKLGVPKLPGLAELAADAKSGSTEAGSAEHRCRGRDEHGSWGGKEVTATATELAAALELDFVIDLPGEPGLYTWAGLLGT